ncbi:MAG: hypothetical protein R3E53_22155 [Myxococcota bacterium]
MTTRRRLADWVPEGPLAHADAILDRFTRWCAESGFELYDAQEEALLELMTGRHVVLSTPTGSRRSSPWACTTRRSARASVRSTRPRSRRS